MFKSRNCNSERKAGSRKRRYLPTSGSNSTSGGAKNGINSIIMNKFKCTNRAGSFLETNSRENQQTISEELKTFEQKQLVTEDIQEQCALPEESSMKACQLSHDRRYLPVRHLIDALCNKVENDFIENEAVNSGSIFHGKQPSLSLNQYLFRCVRNLDKIHKSSPGIDSSGVQALLGSIVYLERVVLNDDSLVVHKLNIYRLLMAGMILATKFLEDEPIGNSFWSKVGGVDLCVLNELEAALLEKCNYKVSLSCSELDTALDVVLDSVLDAVLDDSTH